MRVTAKRVMVALLGATAITAAGAPSGEAADPTLFDAGPGVISDGVSTIAAFSRDGTSVVTLAAASGQPTGTPVSLPTSVSGQPFSWRIVGFSRGRVYVTAYDRAERIGYIDTRTRTYHVLCDQQQGIPCPAVASGAPPVRVVAAGKNWMTAGKTLIRYRGEGATFVSRFATTGERKRYARDVPFPSADESQPVNLDGTRPVLDRRWGFRRSVMSLPTSDANGTSPKTARVRLARIRDRRSGGIDLTRGDGSRSIAFGQRGMCAVTNRQIVLWDKTTRRIWRRSFSGPTLVYRASCTDNRVLLSEGLTNAPSSASALRDTWAWPTTTDNAGWTQGPKLRSGKRHSYR